MPTIPVSTVMLSAAIRSVTPRSPAAAVANTSAHVVPWLSTIVVGSVPRQERVNDSVRG